MVSNAQKSNPYQAYSRASHTVAKTRQVVMLYDGIITNLQQAREAMLNKQIEVRYHKLLRASEIVTGLQMSLDFESGAEAAQVLYDFYSFVDSRIMQLHRTNDAEQCAMVIDEVKTMREMWHQIDQGTQTEQAAALPAAASVATADNATGEPLQTVESADALAGLTEGSVTYSA